SDSVEDTITVGLTIGLSLAPDHATSADPGTSVVFTHTLTNTGNFTDTFDVAAVSDQGWALQYSPLSVTLPARGMASVAVTPTVPGDAISGTVDTTTVTATSGLNTSVSRAIRDETVVRRVPGVALGPDRTIDARPGHHLTLTRHLTNTGSYTDTFTIAVASSWLEAHTPLSATVAAWDTHSVVITLTVPAGIVSPTWHTATITATSAFEPGTSATARETVLVTPYSLFLPLIARDAQLSTGPQGAVAGALEDCTVCRGAHSRLSRQTADRRGD
ncbi:MAG: hypothetical protein PVJ55_10025, partial [Anaerolineae bacterium]